MAEPRKLTVRLDEEAIELLQRMARACGSSVTAFIQAVVEQKAERFETHGYKSPTNWTGSRNDRDISIVHIQERAIEIDIQRRARSSD